MISDIISLVPDIILRVLNKICHLEELAIKIRKNIVTMLLEAGSGHPAGAIGMAEVFAALYFEVMNIDPHKPDDPNRDRLVLSAGHMVPVWYATLAERGYFDEKLLWKLRKFDSPLQGHPVLASIPGIENTSGSLGQGLSQAIGMALAAIIDQKDYRVYCITGDGELQEGQIWEAAMLAPKYNLANLAWIIDRNRIQLSGNTEELMPLEQLRAKLEAFNWNVMEINGHDIEEIVSACNMARNVTQRPSAIIANTTPGKGIDFMENKYEWHGKSFNKTEAKKALAELSTLSNRISKV